MIPMGSYFGTTTGRMLPGNSSIISDSHGIVQAGNSSAASSIFPDSVPGAGLAVEWSLQEQCKLDEGLVKYADEPSIMGYIKIAATLPDKTVRDVALRCRWLKRKHRKAEDHNSAKKVNNRKDKLAESSSNMNIPSVLPQNVAAFSTMMHRVGQSEHMLFEVAGISGTARNLLEKNAQALSQITANLSTFKLQESIDLFCHARNNIAAILNDMREMPGIMRHMPPLPVSVNENLANSLLLNTSQSQVHLRSMMFRSPSGIQLKQEPREGAYC